MSAAPPIDSEDRMPNSTNKRTARRSEPGLKPEWKSQMTQWAAPDELIPSGYGKIPYSEWCRKEAARINRKADIVTVAVRESDGMMALMVLNGPKREHGAG